MAFNGGKSSRFKGMKDGITHQSFGTRSTKSRRRATDAVKKGGYTAQRRRVMKKAKVYRAKGLSPSAALKKAWKI